MRKFSDAFIDKKIAKVDEIHERNNIIFPYPSFLCDGTPVTMTSRDKEEMEAYYKHLRELAYVQGFWEGWSLRGGKTDLFKP